MEKTNKKKCPKCKNSNIDIVSKIENGDAIIRSNPQVYPKFTNIFYQCKCNKCGELFKFWPTKN